MNKIIERIQNEFSETPDLIIRKININLTKYVYIAYLETVSSSDKINDYILKNLNYFISIKKLTDIEKIIPSPNIKFVKELDTLEYYLTNGFTIIVLKNTIIAVETRADINRSIPSPDVEQALYGPKDAFNENYQINLGLIKRRIKSSHLKIKELNIGRKSNTKVGVLYINDIADSKNVNYILKILNKIDVDAIFDSGQLAQYFIENKSEFPTVTSSERPDKISKGLLEGKIAILVDTSPFVLLLPAFFGDFINPIVDNYNKNIKFNALRILRITCFFLTIIVPGYYIAIINYNQETIPTSLLINFSSQRSQVPFPSIVEALILLFICEMLRESDMRFPSSYGSAVSILGALVLGEAAVSAGIVSPIMIIIIAFTFITSLMFVEFEMINAIRHFRIVFLFFASVYGLFGLIISTLIFFIHICSLKTLGKPYFYPIAPFNKNYFNKMFIKSDSTKDTKRSNLLAAKNITKQRNDLL